MKKAAPQLLLTEHFQQFIKASVSGRRLTPSGKRITEGTIVNYKYALRLIEEFETKQETKIRIQLLHRASMRTLQREKNYWSRFFTQFSGFLYKEKGYYDNYVSNVFKILKTFFNYLQDKKGYITGNYHKSFKIPLQQSAPVVLLPEHLQFLILNEDFNKSLNRYQKRARDIFVFGCTVALRFSDLMNLRKTNLVEANNESYLVLFTQKTSSELRIPLPDYVLEIISRTKRKTGKYLLPRLSSTNLNLQIKKLIKLAGWNHTLPKNISCRGRMMEIKSSSGNTWQFYQHITAHTMRRTAITTLLIMGVQENIVRKISGHAPGSKEFYKYVSIAQEYLNFEVKKAYKKLVETPTISPLKISA
jgi:integrase